MKLAVMKLGALTCPSCMQKIEHAVNQTAGVANVKVLFNAAKVKAQFDASVTTADALAEVVRQLGYEVESVKVKEIA